ncbi:MAG: NusG domain II-containing protein [Lachnospiraceae bacterium]|nr:NusG domain II-containing protein [Lachnospiraceae bacterium]
MRDRKEAFIRKSDILLIVFIAVISGLLLTFEIRTSDNKSNPVLTIRVDGELYGTYDLTENRTIQINDTNTCQIKNGEVTMTEATCPDKICMKERAIDGTNGGSIVCLPNKVVLIIENATDSGVDVIAK